MNNNLHFMTENKSLCHENRVTS
uniref:Uncharacterized protein n=1 Tax=Rhizophora mucronata TaxID=61149 RepID=A0A2P2NCV7_RHIMU